METLNVPHDLEKRVMLDLDCRQDAEFADQPIFKKSDDNPSIAFFPLKLARS